MGLLLRSCLAGRTKMTLAALCWVTACAGIKSNEANQESAEKHYEIAVGSFQNGMFEDAKVQIQKVLELDDTHAKGFYLQGLIFLQEGRQMIDALELELCLTDEAAKRSRSRADELHRRSHESFAKAADRFESSSSGYGKAKNSMSVVSLYFGENERAITESQSALSANFYGERYSALANLGWAYYNSGDLIAAMTELRQAVMLNSDFCVGRYRLAQVYLDAEMIPESLDQITKVTQNERCPIQDAWRIEGLTRLRLNKTEEAKNAFRRCVELAPRGCVAIECRQLQNLTAQNTQQ